MKKLTAALCVVLLVFCMFVPGAAAAGPALGATRAYCIIDADTGLVLAQQNMNEELHPASITKVMTLGLACEKAQGNWDDIKLTVTHEDVYSLAGTDSSHIALLEGEEVPLTDALYATQMASANDGANLLAEYFGGGTIADGVAEDERKGRRNWALRTPTFPTPTASATRTTTPAATTWRRSCAGHWSSRGLSRCSPAMRCTPCSPPISSP